MRASEELTVRRVGDDAERAAALALREAVFCGEQGVPHDQEVDGRDGEGLHLVALRDDAVVATCRLLFAARTTQFSRLAVAPDDRRRGAATALLAEAERESRAAGMQRMVLHAQTYTEALYRRDGWQARGTPFWEAGIEHIAMEKEL
jgi:predicted GNAT family N-acyltransferase